MVKNPTVGTEYWTFNNSLEGEWLGPKPPWKGTYTEEGTTPLLVHRNEIDWTVAQEEDLFYTEEEAKQALIKDTLDTVKELTDQVKELLLFIKQVQNVPPLI